MPIRRVDQLWRGRSLHAESIVGTLGVGLGVGKLALVYNCDDAASHNARGAVGVGFPSQHGRASLVGGRGSATNDACGFSARTDLTMQLDYDSTEKTSIDPNEVGFGIKSGSLVMSVLTSDASRSRHWTTACGPGPLRRDKKRHKSGLNSTLKAQRFVRLHGSGESLGENPHYFARQGDQ